MAMGFAIEPPGPATDSAGADHVQRTPQPVLHETFAALAWMVGELHGGMSGPVTETAVIKPSPPAVPQFSASPANAVGVESTSI